MIHVAISRAPPPARHDVLPFRSVLPFGTPIRYSDDSGVRHASGIGCAVPYGGEEYRGNRGDSHPASSQLKLILNAAAAANGARLSASAASAPST